MPFRYGAVARSLHWLTAILVSALFGAGIWIVYFEPKGDPLLEHALYLVHESTGAVLFVVMLIRIGVRVARPPGPLPRDVPPVFGWLGGANHMLLYAVLPVQAVVGFLNANAAGAPLVLFGVLAIPSPLGKDAALGPILSQLHAVLAWVLLALLAAHVGAAAFHGLFRRDGVVQRMV